ncbi:hypothetical protein ACFOG5_07280 [Pedobacter fastidiosus]|uniref:Uncharacterized protein n=1 Tax=Pedobacter fastidiosus TaxID=2765361 RepID=A0ABR7KPM4_9SPHI|nr:hypothetical protein [Pedobacter fastidiosus]MBC6110039.1 hypothetical protein [Pedobacter fastidiosus]
MKNQENKNIEKRDESNTKTSGTSKEKATFDQNGKGASDKFGKAGTTPNESGDEHGVGTAKKENDK